MILKPKPYGNFKSFSKSKEKKQIILCHTTREVGEYLTSLKFRYNGKFNKIPHFVVGKNGDVFQTLHEKSQSNFLGDESLDNKSVIISLENLGWLEKKPLNDVYINWIGSIYKGKVFEKKWRDYFFWEPYSKEQIEMLGLLCSELCEQLKIPKICVGHNTKIEGMGKFEGISCRSNFETRFTDLSPAFDFENLIKKLENEEYSQREI